MRAIANPLQDLTSDAEYVADYLKTIHGPLVLAGHSYGGPVITNAAAGLANVKALVYVDASAPAPGETNGQLSGADSILAKDTPAQLFFTTSYPNAPAGASELYLKENIFIHNFANDLPKGEAERLRASQRGAATVAFGTPSRAAAWKTIPAWYFISTGRSDHHSPVGARHGPACTLAHHQVRRRIAPDTDLPPERGHRRDRGLDLLASLATTATPRQGRLLRRRGAPPRSSAVGQVEHLAFSRHTSNSPSARNEM